jgi:WD40 repeat protein
LILNNEKPHLSKEKYAGIYPGFDPDRDILNDRDLIVEITKIYRRDRHRFERIREFLENQFGRDRGAAVDALKILREGSGKYYEALRGPNGRFRYLNISEILLPGTVNKLIDTMVSINTPMEEENNKKFLQGGPGGAVFSKSAPPGRRRQKNLTVLKVLPVLWAMEIKHAVIVGGGGMGKTVSLLQWWEQLLGPGETGKPVPVFIAMNEFNQVPERKREDFIIAQVLENYGGENREPLTAAQVKKTMKTPLRAGSEFIPSIVLLLDGFNEVTVEKRELLLELNHLTEQCPGIQVVITSRYDMRGNFNWGHWNLVRLKELEEEKVKKYLQGKGMAVPGQERLRGLIKNPMMLTLYAASCEVQENQQDSRYCCFKDTVESPGELLWNFIEAQVAKLPDRVGPGETQVVYYWFLLKYLLPGLGYEMEKDGLFAFTYTQFQTHLYHLCRRFSQDDFLTAFPQIGKYVTTLPVGECSDALARHERAARMRDIFCNELHLLVEEGQTLRFLHQDFRDFFAAVHLLNEAEISISKGEIPGVFKERILDYFVRRLLGEIEGEHRSKPYLVKDEGWKIDIDKGNRLYKVLDLCRGKFEEEVGFAVWNMVSIWKEVREELSGADLSGLDLSGIPLNGVRCSRFYEERYLAAVFDGSRVHEKNLLPRGHSNCVTSAVYSPDGRKILSSSHDETIKEWDAGTGECVKTLTGHTSVVNSTVYSPDGEKILSASNDKTIKEWDAGTSQYMKTLAGHSGRVTSAVYSLYGEKILSASYDNTIKEWDTGTGECVKTLSGHTSVVTSAVYSPDGKRILSASHDKTIKEWDVGSGECVKTLAGHTSIVTSVMYSPDGGKILSASYDKTIKEWDVGTGECVKTLTGHTSVVKSAVYSPDGKKILSASDDNTIKEWDVGVGECVKTLSGHIGEVTSAEYSPDGKKILFTSWDNTIKEWDVGTGKCAKTLAGHYMGVTSAVYRLDGKRILSASEDGTIKEWDTATGECVKTLSGHTHRVTSAVYRLDGKRILSASADNTIKEWDADTGNCLEIHKKEDIIPGYQTKDKNIKVKTEWNKIYVPDVSGQGKEREFINVPGLFIQGCSFQNLEKGSQWSEEGLAILRQYHALV